MPGGSWRCGSLLSATGEMKSMQNDLDHLDVICFTDFFANRFFLSCLLRKRVSKCMNATVRISRALRRCGDSSQTLPSFRSVFPMISLSLSSFIWSIYGFMQDGLTMNICFVQKLCAWVSGSTPSSTSLHVLVAPNCSWCVWMFVWMGYCGVCCKALWVLYHFSPFYDTKLSNAPKLEQLLSLQFYAYN